MEAPIPSIPTFSRLFPVRGALGKRRFSINFNFNFDLFRGFFLKSDASGAIFPNGEASNPRFCWEFSPFSEESGLVLGWKGPGSAWRARIGAGFIPSFSWHALSWIIRRQFRIHRSFLGNEILSELLPLFPAPKSLLLLLYRERRRNFPHLGFSVDFPADFPPNPRLLRPGWDLGSG